jgi:tripartite-type tricarboxylate transporter receptor subunit TctC
MITRRHLLQISVAGAITPSITIRASAQAFPSRYVRLVVPFAPGGGADAVAYPLGNQLSEIWGQRVVIDNKGGAGGNIGAEVAARAAPDGYTLLLAPGALVVNRMINPKLSYDLVQDFAPVTLVCRFPLLLAVPNSSPAWSVKEFIDHAKANPGTISYGSPGTNSLGHLSGELLKQMAGFRMSHVPYRGGGPALNDLIPGRIDALFSALPNLLPHVRSNTVRSLAVTSALRVPFAPDIPAIAESGVKGFDMSGWYALLAPAKTPTAVLKQVHDDTVAALSHPEVTKRLEAVGAVVATSSPDELASLIGLTIEKLEPVIKAIGINLK